MAFGTSRTGGLAPSRASASASAGEDRAHIRQAMPADRLKALFAQLACRSATPMRIVRSRMPSLPGTSLRTPAGEALLRRDERLYGRTRAGRPADGRVRRRAPAPDRAVEGSSSARQVAQVDHRVDVHRLLEPLQLVAHEGGELLQALDIHPRAFGSRFQSAVLR